MYQQDSSDVKKLNDIIKNEMDKLDIAISENKKESGIDIKDVEDGISKGINKDMELLHKVAYLDGNFATMLMGSLIFFIGVFLELIPLFSKITYNASEYFERCKDQRDVKDLEANLVKIKEKQIVGIGIPLEQRREVTEMNRDNAVESLNNTKEYNEVILKHTDDELGHLETFDTEMKKKHPQHYESHIKPLLDESYDKLHKDTMKDISQN